MQLNEKYRCKVVRILPPNDEFDFDPDGYSYDFNLEIFSSEASKWRELVVSSPQGSLYDTLDNMRFAYNGVLYWSGHRDSYFLVLGLDPFNDHECRFTVFDYPKGETFVVECPIVCGGLVRMSDFHKDTRTLFVWDLKEQDHNYKVRGAGKLCLINTRFITYTKKCIRMVHMLFKGYLSTQVISIFFMYRWRS